MKTLFRLLTVLLIAALALSACAPPPAQTTEPPGQAPTAMPEEPAESPEALPETGLSGTVTLWHSWKETEIVALNEVIARFQEQYPDVTFDVLFTPHEDLRGKFETAAATGSGPTVLIGSADWGPALYDAQLVEDLTDRASEELLSGINEAALGAVRYKDALIGLPHTIKGVLLFRNTAIIPEAPATFEELLAAAQEATEGDVVGASLERGLFFSAGHLHGIGGQLIDENGDPAFNTEMGVEWMNLLDSFSEAGPAEYNTDNDINLFRAGRAGMVIDGSWNMTALAEAIGPENLAIDPWPTYREGSLSGYVQTEDLFLSTNAGDNADAGWAFMEFFMTPEAQEILAGVGHIPAITAVEVTDPMMQRAVEIFETGVAFPVIPEMNAYWAPMETAHKSVFDEAADPAEALAQAEESITAAIADIRGQ